MPDRPWRTGLGLMAVLLWSGIIGIPTLLFHMSNVGLEFGQHFHAALMYLASVGLVYWLAARPQTPRANSASPQQSVPDSKPTHNIQIWEAELVSPGEWNRLEPADSAAAVEPTRHTTTLNLTNYLGSSRPRIFYIEPGGIHITLLPGHELEVTASANGAPPEFRVVESDLATQIFAHGIKVAVSAKPTHGRLVS